MSSFLLDSYLRLTPLQLRSKLQCLPNWLDLTICLQSKHLVDLIEPADQLFVVVHVLSHHLCVVLLECVEVSQSFGISLTCQLLSFVDRAKTWHIGVVSNIDWICEIHPLCFIFAI